MLITALARSLSSSAAKTGTNRLLLAAILAAVLGGCAASPQQVQLNPTVEVTSRLAKQPAVQLTINDKRGVQSIGTRGGIYGSSNHITPDRSLADSLRPAAAGALTELGARVDAASPLPINLSLDVESLSYRVDENSTLPLKIKLDAAIRATAERDGKSFSGRYESSQQHSFVKAPSEQRNQEIINDILADTLKRVFNDPRLLGFMEQ